MANNWANSWKVLWQRLFAPDVKAKAEVEQIAVLQQTAANRRAEYAKEKEREAPLPASRKRMEDAEAAHTAALQIWQNKQSRQKSR